jgi:cholesterol transport system auxiliary component
MKTGVYIQTVMLGALLALLAGCSLLSAKPPGALTHYALDDASAAVSPAPSARQPAAASPVIIVNATGAASGFDSVRMVYLRAPQQLEAFANNAWVDTPGRMLAPLLVRALQADGVYRAVLLAPSAAKADWRLDTSIVRLQQDFRQKPSTVRFTLQVTLMDNTTREVIAWRELDAVRVAGADDPTAGALAARLAVQDVLGQLALMCKVAASGWTPGSAPK